MNRYRLIHIIVAKGKASKILSEAKKLGVKGGTIYLAKGTIKSKLLNFLSIYEQEKEMIIICAQESKSIELVERIYEKFNLHKKNSGIIFTTNINDVIGYFDAEEIQKNEVNNPMYKLITTIVDKGKAEDVVDLANEKGARGATILNARGSGSKETLKLFNMEIEPEKEVVLIISDTKISEDIIHHISEKMELRKPGKGILFAQEISDARGMFEQIED